jgi:hypothetical protein
MTNESELGVTYRRIELIWFRLPRGRAALAGAPVSFGTAAPS